VLINGVTIEEAATPASIKNLWILGCGSVLVHPSEVLGSKRMQAFLEAARSEYDIVVLDSPPLLAVADVAIVAPRVDGVLIVARAGKTKVALLDRSIEALDQVRADLIGIVLNDFKLGLSRGSYYGGYGYYGGHSRYYTEADRKPASTPEQAPDKGPEPGRPRPGRSRLHLGHRFMLWRARFVWWMFQLILGRRARARKGASEGLGQA
jgi:Mrp family chromosome partitioning ATPase